MESERCWQRGEGLVRGVLWNPACNMFRGYEAKEGNSPVCDSVGGFDGLRGKVFSQTRL